MKIHFSVRALVCAVSFAVSVVGLPRTFAVERSVSMLPGESWWGLAA